MDRRRARDLLELALSADANRGIPADPSSAALRSATDSLSEAADVLLAADAQDALRLVAALGGFWQDAGLIAEGRAIARRVLEAANQGDGEDPDERGGSALGRARAAAAELAFRQGDQAEATARARAGIDAAAAAGDGVGAATAWLVLARVAFRDGAAAAIESASRAAIDAAPEDERTRRGALHMLAWAAHTAGDVPGARSRFEASLAYRRSVGAGALSEAVELANIADLDLEAGDLPLAARGLRAIVEAARALDSRYLLVNTVPSVAALAAAAGRDEEAAVLFGALEALVAATGMRPDPGGERASERATVLARLGERRFAAAFASGRSIPADAATERCLAVCDEVAASAASTTAP